ncbi:MAG: AsmA family protein [Acidobacteriaceae bacterium]|nr:AsmA family protein [Acidobacteriaceae bacterium]
MRRLLIIVPVLLVLLIVAILGFVLLNVDKYRPQVQAELTKKLDRPVTLGHLGVRLLPLSIRIDSLTIGEAPQFASTKPFATSGEVYVSASLFSLLRGSPDVKEISLERPQIELIRNPAGVWNFSTLGANSSSNKQSGDLTLEELKITDGQAAVTDQKMNQPRSVYDHIDLKLAGFAPGKQFGIDLGVHFPGAGKELLAFNGKAGPLEPGNTATLPVDGHFSLEEVSLAGVNRVAPGTVPDRTDSVVSGDGTISSQGELVGCKGNIKLANTIVRGAKLDYPIDAQFDLSDDRKSDNLQIRSGVLRLGPTAFSVAGSVDSASKPARLNVRLTTNNSSITELARLAGAFGVAFNPAYQVKGTVSADVTAVGPATAPQMNGSLSGRQIVISGGEIRTPVSVPEIALTLTPDVVRSTPFTAQSGTTALNVAFALSHYSERNMLVDATLKTNGANIVELLNMAKAYGVAAAQGITGSGTISVDVHVQGPVEQTAAFVYSGTAQIPNATLVMKSSTEPMAISGANIQFAQSSAVVAANTLKAEGFLLSNVRTNAKFGTGTIQLSPVSAGIFGGKADGTVAIDTRPAAPLCSVKMKLAGVDTNALLSAVSSMKDRLYGSLAAETNSSFELASGPALARSLNGTLNFAVTNGQIKGMNIMGELSRIGGFLGGAPAQGSGSATAVRRLGGTFNIVNGVANTNNLAAALDAGSLSATGSMNLVNEGLDLHATAVLGSGVSQSVGGSRVGGFLNTALANNKGELVLPVLVTGTMAHPVFAPDMQSIAKMKLSNLLPTSTDPSKLTSGILGSVLGKKGAGGVLGGLLGQQPATQQQQTNQQKQPTTAQDAVGSLLQRLGKKKPPQKQQ